MDLTATFANNFCFDMKHKDFNENESATPEQTANQEENVSNNTETQTETVSDSPEVSEVAQLKTQVDELKDKYLRQAAEFDNFRKYTRLMGAVDGNETGRFADYSQIMSELYGTSATISAHASFTSIGIKIHHTEVITRVILDQD